MKAPISRHLGFFTGLLLSLLVTGLWAPAQAADYTYTTNDCTVTIAGYTGPVGVQRRTCHPALGICANTDEELEANYETEEQ